MNARAGAAVGEGGSSSPRSNLLFTVFLETSDLAPHIRTSLSPVGLRQAPAEGAAWTNAAHACLNLSKHEPRHLPVSQCNFIALHFLYGLSQLMPYPVVCARTFQSARCELLVPIQQSPGG